MPLVSILVLFFYFYFSLIFPVGSRHPLDSEHRERHTVAQLPFSSSPVSSDGDNCVNSWRVVGRHNVGNERSWASRDLLTARRRYFFCCQLKSENSVPPPPDDPMPEMPICTKVCQVSGSICSFFREVLNWSLKRRFGTRHSLLSLTRSPNRLTRGRRVGSFLNMWPVHILLASMLLAWILIFFIENILDKLWHCTYNNV